MSTIEMNMPTHTDGTTIAIIQGKQITFRAPCDCKDVTDLKIDGHTYQLLNTSGTPIYGGNVFVEGALVTVILDIEDDDNRKAYIQNGSFGGGLKPATIGTNWIENEATGVKSQRVEVDGITSRNNVFVDHSSESINKDDGSGYGDYADEERQYLNFITNGYAETYDGGIEFFVFGDVNNRDIPIMIEVL